MSNIHDVPLPYHIRVAGYIPETDHVLLDRLDENTGEWCRYPVSEDRFRAMTVIGDSFIAEFDQDWDDYTDELWVPTAEREMAEVQCWNEEYPILDWADWSEDFWAKQLLESAEPSMIFQKFSKNNFVVSKNDTKNNRPYITWRRYSDGTETEGSNTEEAAYWQDTDGTWNPVAQGQKQVFTKGEA